LVSPDLFQPLQKHRGFLEMLTNAQVQVRWDEDARIAARLREGEGIDVVVSAHAPSFSALLSDDLLVERTHEAIASDTLRLVQAERAGGPGVTLRGGIWPDVMRFVARLMTTRDLTFAMPDPERTGVGHAVRAALEGAGVWDEVSKLAVMTKGSGAVMDKLGSRDAAFALVPRSLAMDLSYEKTLCPVPASKPTIIAYEAAAAHDTAQARLLVDALVSDTVQQSLANQGFQPPRAIADPNAAASSPDTILNDPFPDLFRDNGNAPT
jgi:ABC-type molybdate transport system substrate-binding protein